MRYFDAKDILAKVRRLYDKGALERAHLEGDLSLFPYRIGLKRITERMIREDYTTILKEAEAISKSGLPCEYKTFSFSSIGKQRLPVAVLFQSRQSLLEAIGELETFEEAISELESILKDLPQLKELLIQKPLLIRRYKDQWHRLCSISSYLLKHPRPNIYIRELPIEGVDTKFVETHKKILDTLLSHLLPKSAYDEKVESLNSFGFERKYGFKIPPTLIRFRILDSKLLISGLEDLSIPIEDFAALNLGVKRVFVVENMMSFLAFPRQSESIVIFGSGYGVERLKNISWLKNLPIFYWGDIDSHGLAILSRFRRLYPQVRSLLMDEQTLLRYRDLSVKDKIKRELKVELEYLNDKERSLLEMVQKEQLRLEQERIAIKEIERCLEDIRSAQFKK